MGDGGDVESAGGRRGTDSGGGGAVDGSAGSAMLEQLRVPRSKREVKRFRMVNTKTHDKTCLYAHSGGMRVQTKTERGTFTRPAAVKQ